MERAEVADPRAPSRERRAEPGRAERGRAGRTEPKAVSRSVLRAEEDEPRAPNSDRRAVRSGPTDSREERGATRGGSRVESGVEEA